VLGIGRMTGMDPRHPDLDGKVAAQYGRFMN
jgi:hypothetical protein